MSFLKVSAGKTDEKNGVICLVFMSPSWVMAVKLSEIVSLLQFFADVRKKSKAVMAIYVYAFETLVSLFWKTVLVIMLWPILEDIRVWS